MEGKRNQRKKEKKLQHKKARKIITNFVMNPGVTHDTLENSQLMPRCFFAQTDSDSNDAKPVVILPFFFPLHFPFSYTINNNKTSGR